MHVLQVRHSPDALLEGEIVCQTSGFSAQGPKRLEGRVVDPPTQLLVKVAQRGVNRRNLKFYKLKHTLRPGLALELNSSSKQCFSC
jgi:hypothetical protein